MKKQQIDKKNNKGKKQPTLLKPILFFAGSNDGELSIRFEGIMRYIPLIVCGGFFLLTILNFAFGPLDWNIKNPLKLYSFLIACVFSLTAGYLVAVVKGRTPTVRVGIDVNKLQILCIIISLAIYIPTVYTRTGKFYPDIYTGLTNTGVAYRTSKFHAENSSQLFEYIRFLLGPFLIMVTPVTLFFMPKLSKATKILGVIVIILTTMIGISQGMNKYCADMTAQIIIYLALLFFSKKEKGQNLKHKLKTLLLMILVVGLFFGYYASTMRNRVSYDCTADSNVTLSDEATNKAMVQNSKMSHATVREDYILFRYLPDKIKSAGTFLASYVSHGYKGLSIAMDREFTSTYGLGFSQFFRHNILKPFGGQPLEEKIEKRTYADKTRAEAWYTGEIWSTFFVFPASDIGFPGTVLLVFFIGYLWALSWKDALISHNPFAVATFLNLCFMVIYFSANNQLFQGGESFIGFTVVFAAWLITRWQAMKKGKAIKLEGETAD